MKISAGCLLIHVMGARGLAGKDKDKMSDPYCLLKIGSQTFKTQPIERNLAPRWNETFRYEMTESCPDIFLTVWDEKTKQFMGEVTISLEGPKEIPFQLAKEHWHRLRGKKEAPRTTDIKQMKKQRKAAKSKAKKHDYSDLVSGEVLIRLGQKASNDSSSGSLTSALMKSNQPVRFEDYEKVALEDIIAEAEQIVDESLQSTERSLRLTHQIRELGFSTLAQLQDQGEKLRHVQEGVIQINADLKQGERELRSISSIGGAIMNSMTSRPENYKYRHINQKKNVVGEISAEDALRYQLDDPHRSLAGSSADAYSTRQMLRDGAFDQLSAGAQHSMLRTEDNLDEISAALDDISMMSKQMGAEIQEHNRMLEELGPAVARTTERTKRAANKTRRQW